MNVQDSEQHSLYILTHEQEHIRLGTEVKVKDSSCNAGNERKGNISLKHEIIMLVSERTFSNL